MTFLSLSYWHPASAHLSKKGCFGSRIKLKSCLSTTVSRRHRLKLRLRKKIERKEMSMRVGKLKEEMEEIGEEQKLIKEGQRQVQEKFEAVEAECEQLRKETNLIIQQSAHTQLRLVLMFNILKAREERDFTKAAQLTQLLREIIARTTTSME